MALTPHIMESENAGTVCLRNATDAMKAMAEEYVLKSRLLVPGLEWSVV